jgi:hypothetical protein
LNKRYLIRRRKGPWTTLGGLLPPSLDILEALALIGCRRHHHRLPPGLLLRLLSGLLLPPVLLIRLLLGLLLPPALLLLPSSIDIESQCNVVLLRLLKFFLDRSQFIF